MMWYSYSMQKRKIKRRSGAISYQTHCMDELDNWLFWLICCCYNANPDANTSVIWQKSVTVITRLHRSFIWKSKDSKIWTKNHLGHFWHISGDNLIEYCNFILAINASINWIYWDWHLWGVNIWNNCDKGNWQKGLGFCGMADMIN